jgi:hypothetical protein
VKSIESLGVNPVDMAHAPGNVPSWRLNKKMIMIRHQAISRYPQFPQSRRLLENLNEIPIIIFTCKDLLTPPPAIHDVVPRILIL